jgi:hypothetical protein
MVGPLQYPTVVNNNRLELVFTRALRSNEISDLPNERMDLQRLRLHSRRMANIPLRLELVLMIGDMTCSVDVLVAAFNDDTGV